jgi:hypothetical protein
MWCQLGARYPILYVGMLDTGIRRIGRTSRPIHWVMKKPPIEMVYEFTERTMLASTKTNTAT